MQKKKKAKEASLLSERPVTNLLKALGFVGAQCDEATASELSIFARMNRGALVELGVDLSALTKKHLMPQLTAKIREDVAAAATWVHAPPKTLPAPQAPAAAPAAAPTPVPAAPAAADASEVPVPPLETPAPEAEEAMQSPKRARAS